MIKKVLKHIVRWGLAYLLPVLLAYLEKEIMKKSKPESSTPAKEKLLFHEAVVTTRDEALAVVEKMGDIFRTHDQVTVMDFYELVGLSSTYSDQHWGWTRASFSIKKVDGGYSFELPRPQNLRT